MFLLRRRTILVSLTAALALVAPVLVPSAQAVSIKAAVPAGASGTTATAVFAGGLGSCALLKGGQIKCWGSNVDGKLGLGDTSTRGDGAGEMGDYLPTVDLGTGRKVKSVAMGENHTCAILDNGLVKCWGDNEFGQLGLGSTSDRGDAPNEMGNNLPYVRFGGGRKAKSLALGVGFSCALLDNATVKCWGKNDVGQLGLGDTASRGDNESVSSLPVVDLGRKAKGITAGSSHACALLDNGTVKCWGGNDFGQLGLGDTSDRGDGADEMGALLGAVPLGRKAKSVGAGRNHNCALLDNGTVKCWGYNGEGSLGLGDNLHRGDDESVTAVPAVDLGTTRKVKTLITGGLGWHNCATFDDGSIKCWGYNDGSGTLGLGDDYNHGDNAGEMGTNLPFLVVGGGRTVKAIIGGSDHTCSLLDNNTVKCWGWNRQGQLGYGDQAHRGDNEAIDAVPSVNLGVRVKSVYTGAYHSCALLENNTVQCLGENDYGQLGLGDTSWRGNNSGEMGDNLPAVDLGTGRTAKALGVGPEANHSCAILDNGLLKCWGHNQFGQLGLGDTGDRGDGAGEMGDNLAAVDLGTGRKAKAVSVSQDFSCALLDNGTVKCWGKNEYGQLGLGNTTTRGDNAGEMGDALLTVDLGSGRKAKSVAAGGDFACALLDNSTVKCWGNNLQGQLGQGDRNGRGDAAGEMGNSLLPVNLGIGRKAVAIAAGWEHACAILDNGTVKCWGDNGAGQLGQGDVVQRGVDEDQMGNDLEPVDLGTGRKAKAIAMGDAFSCALLDNGTVKCWGYGGNGALGYGDVNFRGDNEDEMGDYLPAIAVGGSRRAVAISGGGAHTCALLDDGSLRCWGYGAEGALGQGDTETRGDGPGEMGSALKPVPFTG